MQEVPLYSAIRVNGERLYDYAFDNVKEKVYQMNYLKEK